MQSLIAWAGGKSRLRSLIIKRIPEHTCYVEPFMGAAWVFFGKERSKVEILNDLDEELVNLFQIVKADPKAFADGVEYLLSSRRQYSLFKNHDPKKLCPCARAVRFYYLIQLGFGCKRNQMTFGTGAQRPSSFSPEKVAAKVRDVHRRLAGVTIECLPAVDLIKRYDRPTTFQFVDPPYHGVAQPYAHTMSEADQVELRDALAGLKGKFLMTMNDHPIIRRLYRGFDIDVLPTRYSLPTSGSARARGIGTLLVGNFSHVA